MRVSDLSEDERAALSDQELGAMEWFDKQMERERLIGGAVSAISIAVGGCLLALLHWTAGDPVFEGGGASMFWALVVIAAINGIVDAVKWYRSMRREEV